MAAKILPIPVYWGMFGKRSGAKGKRVSSRFAFSSKCSYSLSVNKGCRFSRPSQVPMSCFTTAVISDGVILEQELTSTQENDNINTALQPRSENWAERKANTTKGPSQVHLNSSGEHRNGEIHQDNKLKVHLAKVKLKWQPLTKVLRLSTFLEK